MNASLAENGAPKRNEVGIFTLVWVSLLGLTAVTIAAAQLNFGRLAIVICLSVAAAKSVLVLLYFMHLRHEKRLAIKLALPIGIVALAIFIGITFIDVMTR
jgi:cytochrome c oxidase subunit 4